MSFFEINQIRKINPQKIIDNSLLLKTCRIEFINSKLSVLVCYGAFLTLLLTTEAMGIWRFAEVFTVALRQSECGRKNLQNALQPACAHRYYD